MMQYQHILVAVDFSEQDKKTLDAAERISKLFGAKLSIVHFVEPLPATAFSYASAVDIDNKRSKNSKDKLALIGEKLNIPTQDQIVKECLPKAGIVNLAKKLSSDLIILGSHGHHGLTHLLGSTAHAVTSHASCSVLIVK
jgi:universal stress protein A